jgi:hypothetical protein
VKIAKLPELLRRHGHTLWSNGSASTIAEFVVTADEFITRRVEQRNLTKAPRLQEGYRLICCNVFWISGSRRGDDANRRIFQSRCYGRAHTDTERLVHVKVTGVRYV